MPQHNSTDGFAAIAAEFNKEFMTNSARFAEYAAEFKGDVEAKDRKLKADLKSLFQQNPKAPANQDPTGGKWLLARKAWAWLNREST